MPGTPPTTPRAGIPRFAQLDPAVFATELNAAVDQIDAEFALTSEVGAQTVHVASWTDQASPNGPAGSIVGEVPAPVLAGQTLTLIGAMTKCSVLGSTITTFKVQTDHGSTSGVLADVPGLTVVQPATGRFAEVDAAPPVSLSRGDSVAIVVTTPGNSKGCKVALLFGRAV